MHNWGAVFEDLLGVVPQDNKLIGGRILLSWLKDTFSHIPDDEEREEVLQRYARAYLLFLLGCTIFVDATDNKVHACYLLLLRDLDEVGLYSWGSAALAHLYRALSRGCLINQRETAGFFSLLQTIPIEVEQINRGNRRGRQKVNWAVLHKDYIDRWNARLDHIHIYPQSITSSKYMEWYWERTVRYLTPPIPPCPVLMRYHPRGYAAEVMGTAMMSINQVLNEGLSLYPG
ncbi:hypothetical protein QJS10_CPB21g01150 [Acorus calamus]|uniref:Aminotransferase-like plant mobile domain-containing protein n=1 Tax=Acorus calamus TaxID=4465 RepID=A0AAV9C7C7_ACOCL|nr:hypothetical protein QJS10_CPB21g01150 [Acorus calamus]